MIFPNICVWEHHSVVSIFHTKNVLKEAGPEWFLQERSSRIDQALPSYQCCFLHNHWLVIFTPNFHFLSVKLLTNAGSKSFNLNFLPNFLSQTLVARTQPNAMTKTSTQTEKNTTDVWTAQYQAECARSQILKIEFLKFTIERKFLQVLELHIPACSHLHTPGGKLLPQPRWLQTTLVDRFTRIGSNPKLAVQAT